MENFAVIDTETNWHDEVMSIGAVIADANTFKTVKMKYYILTPENLTGGMYSEELNMHPFKVNVIFDRETAIRDLVECLNEFNVKSIFAYNAPFDYNHLPELHNFIWYDIMRIAAYRQYNFKIRECDCCKTGRLKSGFGVQSIIRLLTGWSGYRERHNALSDALHELNYIMQPLGRGIDGYIPYNPQIIK